MYIITQTDISGDSDCAGSSVGGLYATLRAAKVALERAADTMITSTEIDPEEDVYWFEDRTGVKINEFDFLQIIELQVDCDVNWIPLG